MKIRLVLLALAGAGAIHAAQYQDQPQGLTEDGAALIRSYEEQARKTLPQFDAEFLQPDGRRFYVITKLYEKANKQGRYEQIYVRVDARKDDRYQGRIASDPVGPVKFKKGAPLEVFIADVADWCIVLPDGEELGNLTGKAMDALAAHAVAFIISMKPTNGKFSEFSVVSVINGRTQQKVREIVPADVIAKVEKEAAIRFGGTSAPDEKEKFQYIIVSFPQWEFVKP